MSENKLKEVVIHQVVLNGKIYLSKEDVMDLIQKAASKAQSLSSKNDLQNLFKALFYGYE